MQKLSWPLPFTPAIRWPLSCTLACRKYSQPTFETEFVDVLRKILSDADMAVKSAVALLCVVAALLCLVAAAWLLFDVLRKTVAAIPKWVVAVSMVSLIRSPFSETIGLLFLPHACLLHSFALSGSLPWMPTRS